MKAKHLLNTCLPLTQQSYYELRKGLRLGKLIWHSFPKELKNAYHRFEEDERESDFEKKLHEGTDNEYDYKTPI